MRRTFGGLVMVVALLMCATSASAGQIVYTHGGDLWAMNENGTSPHPLVVQAQLEPGATSISDPSADPVGGAVAFTASANAPDGNCEINCGPLYSLVNGTLTRLSGPPANCLTLGTECVNGVSDPAVTTNGRVVYQAFTVFGSIGFGDTATDTLEDTALNGSEAPAPWGLPSQTIDDPGIIYDDVADPANPNLIAYTGGLDCNSVTTDTGCETGIVVDDSLGHSPYNVSYDDEGQHDLAFSPDGRYLADVEAGEERGIWIYTNEDINNPANESTWHAWYVLADPDEDSNDGSNPDQTAFEGLTVTDTGAVVFDDGTNIFSVPQSCWGPSSPYTTPNGNPDCGTFSTTSPTANPNVTQLTTDGTNSTRDTHPAWTAATVAALGPPAMAPSSPPPSAGPPHPPAPTIPTIQLVKLTEHGAITGAGGVTFEITLNAPGIIVVKVSELPGGASAATKKHRKKGPKLIGTVSFSGKAGLNVLKIKKVGGHALAPGRYVASITIKGAAPGTKPKTLSFTVKPKR